MTASTTLEVSEEAILEDLLIPFLTVEGEKERTVTKLEQWSVTSGKFTHTLLR